MREAAGGGGGGGGGDHVNLSINGQSQVPPGFRFHPTEEELLHYYLRKKVASDKIDLDVIREVDLNKLEPWDIQERCKIGSTPQNDWYFFSHKDKKYPTGTRTNRATAAGFWKATGRDKIIYSGYKRIGLRKTLVFYKGRAPHGQKSDWIMHEYRLDDAATDTVATTTTNTTTTLITSSPGLSTSGSYIIGGGDQGGSEEGWVVCRVFRKKNYQKSLESPRSASTPNLSNILHHHHHHQLTGDSKSHVSMTSSPAAVTADGGSEGNGVLDQILMYMGKHQRGNSNTDYCKPENYDNSFGGGSSSMRALLANEEVGMRLEERFLHLPRLVADHEQQQQQQGHCNLVSSGTTSICYQQQSFSDEAMATVTTENNSIINNNNNKYISNNNNNEASCTNQGTGYDVTTSGNDNKLRGGGGMNMMMSQQQQVIVNDWVALDRLVASQLNGHLHHDEVDFDADDDDHDDHHHHHGNGTGMHMDLDHDHQFRSIPHHHHHHHHHHSGGSIVDNDLIWTNSFTKSASSPSSSSDPLCHLSV